MANEKKSNKWTTLRTGIIKFQDEDGKYIKSGSVTIGLDSEDRHKIMVNMDNEPKVTHSGFLNKPLNEDNRKKLQEFRKQLQESENVDEEEE